MPSWKLIVALIVLCVLASNSPIQAQQAPGDWGFGKPYSYIVWDGHRFAVTPEDHERDARYFKDLGFTHSLVDARLGALNPKTVESRRLLLASGTPARKPRTPTRLLPTPT